VEFVDFFPCGIARQSMVSLRIPLPHPYAPEPMSVLPMLAAALLAWPATQSVAPPDPVTEALRRFDLLSAEEQEVVVEELRAAVLAGSHPLLQAAATGAAHPRVIAAETAPWTPERAFDADLYAPALKLRTRVVDVDDAAWRKVVRTFLRDEAPLPPTRWRWDAGRDALIAPALPIAPRAVVEALLRGRWPDDGLEAARVAGMLDGRDALGPAAGYFAHHYRDRDGRIYRGVTLAAVWGSGLELEISDVEAVAWLRLVEGREDIESPIPGRLHRPIHELIKRGYARVHEEQVLREGLAARLIDPTAPLPPTLRGVTRLIDDALVAVRHDPLALESLLTRLKGRAATLAEFSDLGDADDGRDPQRARHRAARGSLTQAIADAALVAARDAGLLGFGRR
jgi:hypothetical protein